ncbi:hypothetical protein N7539_001731 [Penicillium diatomitis]|uniref:Uncharacterized protein n=1 Tax=Penicillium diatomitis TaxID=2819901 RepID=A0A9X0C0D6_9EURO|nr:uncharacterized protein N7539_001731 [Penicillium diatomitis]KAJ5492985.1 hypothetical protein N7539_001731 [Penicillium diatomitis]
MIKYTLVNKTGFYDQLLPQYGVQESWVEISEVETSERWCIPNLRLGGQACHNNNVKHLDYPHAKKDPDISNPKATTIRTLSKRWLPLFPGLPKTSRADGQRQGNWRATEKKEEKQKANLIITVISAVLMILPFAGEVAGSLGAAAWVANAILLADVASNIAIASYDIIQNPKIGAYGAC